MVRTASNAYQSDSGHNKTLVTILGPGTWKKADLACNSSPKVGIGSSGGSDQGPKGQ